MAQSEVEGLDAVAGEGAGEEGGRSRRRRRRGRGRGDAPVGHEIKVENRATNEGMPPDGSPETPMAVMVDTPAETTEIDTPAVAPEPQRRRVRRKSASANVEIAAEPHPDTAIEPNEAAVEGAPVELDVTPQEALAAEPVEVSPVEEPAPIPVAEAVLAEPFVAPVPEIDVEAIIAEDPNQIVAPPEKPKRGWWRR